MNLQDNLKDYLCPALAHIEKSIREYLPPKISEFFIKAHLGKIGYRFDKACWQEVISGPFYNLFNRGGKRLRPALCCLIYHSLKGKNSIIYRFSIIPELLHHAALIIDDIQDNSQLRRGKPTIHNIYGVSIAINAANFLHFYPQLIIKESNLQTAIKARLYSAIVQEICCCYIGQGMDVLWSQKGNFSVSLDEYLQMVSYKTASLFRVGCVIAGLLAKAPLKKIKKIVKIAELIGVAFQVQDDLLNLRINEQADKDIGEDVREGKLTYPVVYTLSEAKAKDRERLKRILCAKTKNLQHIQEAIYIMEKYNSFLQARRFIQRLIQQAKHSLYSLNLVPFYKGIFEEFLDYILPQGRKDDFRK
jgi:geranylgeranyl pyrophosphate synthase